MSDKSKTETMNKEANQKPTREQIVSAIKARDTVVAWLTAEFALIYEPDTDKIRVCPGAVLADVQQIAAVTPRKTLVVNGISGLAYAALEQNKLLYSCNDPRGNESAARREANQISKP